MHLFLIRHGECRGQVVNDRDPDSPLTDYGRHQAKQAARVLERHGVTHIVSSPLIRALETAQIVASTLAHPTVEVWPDLREHYMAHHRGYGRMALLKLCTGARFPAAITASGWDHGGDTPSGAFARCQDVLDRVREEFATGDRVALVTHGGCANSLLHVLLGLAPNAPHFFELGNGSISHLYLVPEAECLQIGLTQLAPSWGRGCSAGGPRSAGSPRG